MPLQQVVARLYVTLLNSAVYLISFETTRYYGDILIVPCSYLSSVFRTVNVYMRVRRCV
jgi:hypothetical protein